MSILLAIGMSDDLKDDLEDGEILSEDEFTDIDEQVTSNKLQDHNTMNAANTEVNGDQTCKEHVKKRSDYARLQIYHKKTYMYQYQNPKWNGVTKYHQNVGVSWWDQFQDTNTAGNHVIH